MNNSFVFTCKYRGGQYLLDGHRVRFVENTFATDNKELAEKIRSLPEFGREVFEGASAIKHNNVVQGSRASHNLPEIPDSSKTDLIRFGFLQGKLLNASGAFRKDATEDEINEYETLKTKLGV